MSGIWSKEHFSNEQSITLELACGGGEYTLSLARNFPNRNFIGVDIKGNRIWKGARVALAEELTNAAWIRTRIEQLPLFLAEDEVSEIWITFPDPFLKASKSNRRLTSPRFLEAYRKFLKPGGKIHLKTDSPELYAFTLEVLEEEQIVPEVAINDIYAGDLPIPELAYKTFYEKMHLADGRKIKYVRFTL